MRYWCAGIYNIPNLSFPMGEGLHRILSYQSYASGDNDRVHSLSFWDMRYVRSVQPHKCWRRFTFVYRKWTLKVSSLLILFLILSNDYVVRKKNTLRKL